jgi:hypothetical protein
MSNLPLRDTVRRQRELLTGLLGRPLRELSAQCAGTMADRLRLEALLEQTLPRLEYCKHLYVLDGRGVQLTDNITREGHDPAHFGRDRSERPYMQEFVGSNDFRLSDAYISRNKKRPSVTAIQLIRNAGGDCIGYLGADYDLRELPLTAELYRESDQWRQLKGDPAIRRGVFTQTRVDSRMDLALDRVLPLVNELMTEYGVFHSKLHFSSSRATFWLMDDPWSYRIVGMDDLLDPYICLAYPRTPYTERAVMRAEQIAEVLELFRKLRFADENVYLRSGSLNLINGMVGLTFSCDGSHYMRYDEFLNKDTGFWFGAL